MILISLFKKHYSWIVVILLFFVGLLNYADRQIISTLKDYMSINITELNNAEMFGNLMAIFLWVYGIFSPISGILSDFFNRKHIIIWSLIIWSISVFLTGYSNSYNEIYFLRGLMGVSEAFYIPAALSLISSYHPKYTLSLAISIHTIGIYIGQIFGSYGAYFADKYSWHHVFIYMGIIGILYGIILLILLKDKFRIKIKKQYKLNFKSFINNKYFYIILFSFVIISVCGWTIRNWIPTIFSNKLNIEQISSGPISIITFTICSFIGAISGGFLSDKLYKLYNNGRLYITILGLILMIPSFLILCYSINIYMLIISCIFFGLGFGLYDINNMPLITTYISKNENATIYGIMNMFGLFGGAYATSLFGKLIDLNNSEIGFFSLSILIFISLLFFIKSLK